MRVIPKRFTAAFTTIGSTVLTYLRQKSVPNARQQNTEKLQF